MFGIFKKQKPKIDLEKLIYNIAEYKREDDYLLLLRALIGRDLYLPIEGESVARGSLEGEKITVDSTMDFKIRATKGPEGRLLVPASTTKNHLILKGHYAALEWIELLKMTMKIEKAEGVLVQGVTSLVVVVRSHIPIVLKFYEDMKKK